MLLRSATSEPMITATRTATDRCRIGRSMRRAKAAVRRRTAMLIATGTSTRERTTPEDRSPGRTGA